MLLHTEHYHTCLIGITESAYKLRRIEKRRLIGLVTLVHTICLHVCVRVFCSAFVYMCVVIIASCICSLKRLMKIENSG